MGATGGKLLLRAAVTLVLAAACGGIWWGLGPQLKGTLLAEFGVLVPVLAIFAFLGLAEVALARLLGPEPKSKSDDG